MSEPRLPIFRTPSKYPIVDGVEYQDNDRQICLLNLTAGKAAYRRRTQEMADRQGWQCAICTRIMNPPFFDHEVSRAAGRQDDRIYDSEGGWKNACLCGGCNSKKGSIRYHWTEDRKYVPL